MLQITVSVVTTAELRSFYVFCTGKKEELQSLSGIHVQILHVQLILLNQHHHPPHHSHES